MDTEATKAGSCQQTVHLLRSTAAILRLQPILHVLAAASGMACAMEGLEHLLQEERQQHKRPMLVVVLNQSRCLAEIRAEDLLGTLLVFEYDLLGVGTRVLATQETSGLRSLLACPEHVHHVLSTALQVLRPRAEVLLITFVDSQNVGGGLQNSLSAGTSDLRCATRRRDVEQLLPLASTLDDTFMTLGKKTRANLRYYTRRLLREVPSHFVADAKELLNDDALAKLNEGSLNPMNRGKFLRATRAVRRLPGGYLCGLRTDDGKWLSLIGGWRRDGATILLLQMNTSGYERYSLNTVMRNLWMEHEIALGTQEMRIIGGTPHSMQHAFTRMPVTDLLVWRPGLRGSLLHAFAHRKAGRAEDHTHQNFLLRMMAEQQRSA